MLLLLTLACLSRTFMPYCEEISQTEISDEEETGFGSPASLLEQLTLEQEAVGTWADGGQTPAQLRVARGSGSAVLVEVVRAERVTESRALGPGYDFYPAIDVVCSDRLEVPVDIALRTEDGLLDLELPGLASRSLSESEAADSGAVASRGMGADELPVFERDPAEHQDLLLHLGVSAAEGDFRAGTVSWSGVSTGERPAQVWERVLELDPS